MPARMIVWGSYDEGKPRVRLLLDELEARGALSARINIPVWKEVRDKAVVGRGRVLKLLLCLLASYPAALAKLLRQPKRGAVLLGYPAIPDIFALWPVARLCGHKIVFDAFIPLHNTLVDDRRLLRRKSLTAHLVWRAERLALRLSDVILVDTDQHGAFFAKEFGIQRDRFQTVLVGAEPAFWNARNANITASFGEKDFPTVLFYGQLIPLHGLAAILDAIRLTKEEPIRWLVIGSGQEEPKLRRFLTEEPNDKVKWLHWVDYEQLPAIIDDAKVALGIFGTSDKAARVIPNKAFQVLAAGKPLITRESPAMAALAKRYPKSIRTVPAGDGERLADAIREALRSSNCLLPLPIEARAQLGPAEGVQRLLARLAAMESSTRR